MRTVTWIIKCYPRRWRERYQEEMLALLEQHTITLKTVLDLLLGACEAHLNSIRRSKEESMFHRMRDLRTLSLIYISALAIFLASTTLWITLNGSLSFQDNPLGSNTDAIAGTASIAIIPGLSVIALLVIAINIVKNALKNHQSERVAFAIICFAAGIASVGKLFFTVSADAPPLSELILAWLLLGGIGLAIGAGLFVTGVKGAQVVKERRWWFFGTSLIIDLLLPACLASYGRDGFVFFLASSNDPLFFLFTMLPYLVLGALLLALTSSQVSSRAWSVARVFGIVFACTLLTTLVTIVIWNINRWVGGGVWIFEPNQGIWPLFGGQWIGPLVVNALVLTSALVIALLALIRSFPIQADKENKTEAIAA